MTKTERDRKIVLVTGAGGMIGKVVVKKLAEAGYGVRAMIHTDGDNRFGQIGEIGVVRGDMEDVKSLENILAGCWAVVHLAANQYDPVVSFRVNVGGVKNLISAMKKKGVTRVVNVSTMSTKIAVKGVYAQSKAEADEVIKKSGLKWTIIKPSVVYGEGGGGVFGTMEKYVNKLPIIPVLGNGETKFWPIWVEDVAEAIIKCLGVSDSIGKVYDLGSLEGISFNQLIKLIQKSLNKKQPVVHIPYKLSLVGARFLGMVMRDPPLSVDNVLGSNQEVKCDPRVAIKELGLRPIGIEEGIRRVLKSTK